MGELPFTHFSNTVVPSCIVPPYGPPPAPRKGRKKRPLQGIRNKPARYREHMQHWLSMTAGAFNWLRLPEYIPRHYLEQLLQLYGWAAMIKTKSGELQVAGPPVGAWNGKWTPYWLPAGCIVTNPYATDWDGEYTFGENAVLCRCTPNFISVAQIIGPRVEMQTETDVTFICALTNLRLINMLRGKDDDASAAADIVAEQIEWGCSEIITAGAGKTWSGSADEPAIEALPLAGVPSAYIQQLVEAQQYIHASLYNDLGIQSNWNAKREALSEAEIGAGNEALRPLIDIMLDCRQQFCDEVNRLFGTDIGVELAGAWKQREQVDDMEEAQAEAAEAIADAQEEHAEELVVEPAADPAADPADGEAVDGEAEEVSTDADSGLSET